MNLIIPNTYADRLNPYFGTPTVLPAPGESFDVNNDLFLSDCGEIVFHRDGHVTRGTRTSVTSDALLEYNRRHMDPRAFVDCYGGDDTRSEDMMLLGDAG